MGFGRLFHKEGPMYDQRRVSLEKRVLKPYKTISYVSSAVRSEFKHFIRIEGVLLLTNMKADALISDNLYYLFCFCFLVIFRHQVKIYFSFRDWLSSCKKTDQTAKYFIPSNI